MRDDIKEAVQDVIKRMMDRVMANVLVNDPFIPEEHHAKKPLYAALVPDEIFKGSHFERRFVTPFGTAWELLAITVAKEVGENAARGYSIAGRVKADRLRRIQEILNELEHSTEGKTKRRPNWQKELQYVLAGGGELIPTTVVCDIYVKGRKKDERFAFELKAPLPNSDQTKVSKEKILKLYAMEPRQIDAAYYALPYNPYGSKRSDYAWSFPKRWFDMANDEVVLIGNEFWDKVGGAGTYEAFIAALEELGRIYKDRIYREFLGIEPPASRSKA